VLSYTMHPFRPRFSLSRVRHLWSFSQWALIRSIGVYFDTQFDRFLVGRISGASTMGAYTLATEIAQMPSTELLQPLGRVLFPAFVATKHDPARLREAYLVALAVQALLAIPAGVGLACVADRAVMIMLGAQWESAIPFVQTLALVFALAALSHAAGYLLITIGKIRTLSLFVWVQNIVFLSIAGVMFSSLSALDIAHLRLGVAAFGLVLFLGVILLEVRELRATDLLRAIWRPATAAGLMALSDMLVSFPDSLPLLLAFLLEVALGALSYSVALLGLWALSGRPQGAEAYILAKLKLSRFLPAAQRSDAQ
jgi:lipopolysaccharide exporter